MEIKREQTHKMSLLAIKLSLDVNAIHVSLKYSYYPVKHFKYATGRVKTKDNNCIKLKVYSFKYFKLFFFSLTFTIHSNLSYLSDPMTVGVGKLFTAVDQVVACGPVTQRARVRSSVGTSFLGEVLSGFFLTCKTNVGKF